LYTLAHSLITTVQALRSKLRGDQKTSSILTVYQFKTMCGINQSVKLLVSLFQAGSWCHNCAVLFVLGTKIETEIQGMFTPHGQKVSQTQGCGSIQVLYNFLCAAIVVLFRCSSFLLQNISIRSSWVLFVYPPESQKSSLYYVMQSLKAQLPNVVVKVGQGLLYSGCVPAILHDV